MTALTIVQAPDNASAAGFRLWGSGVDGTFVTLGWVQTSDTGQINWTTVAAPSVANTAMGYSIFRMNDTLQATKPVFIKVEYGGGASPSWPSMWLTIGTGSDGSGTITGISWTRAYIAGYSNITSISYPSYFSGDSGRYCCALFTGNASNYYQIGFSIERTRDSSGTISNVGLMVCMFPQPNSGVVPKSQYIPFTGTAPSAYSAINCVTTNATLGISSFGNTVNLYPIKTWTPGESDPLTNLFMYYYLDLSPYQNYSVPIYGGTFTYTYKTIPGWVSGNNYARPNPTNMSLIMRYD